MSLVVLSVPILIVFPEVPVPIFTFPVVPESTVMLPVVPVVKDRFPEVAVLIDDEDRPDSVKAPEVPAKFKAPVVRVSPFDAVSVPSEVMVAPPDVEMLVVVVAPRPVTLASVSASVEVTVKVEPEATMFVIPDPVNVKPPPKETEPLPLLPAVVMLLFARFALVIPAVPDRLVLVSPEIVLLPAVMVLPVNV